MARMTPLKHGRKCVIVNVMALSSDTGGGMARIGSLASLRRGDEWIIQPLAFGQQGAVPAAVMARNLL